MDRFKKWLNLSESIIINDHGAESSLHVVEPHFIKEFNYQWDEGYSTFFIAPYQAKKVGYVSLGTSPTHVGITKTTPIEAGKGVDISFIKNLYSLLSQKFPPVQYKEGNDNWLSSALGDQYKTDNNQYQNTKTPDFKQGASNQQKITPGVSVSRASGSWSYIFRSSYVDHAIQAVLSHMKQAATPLIENDLMDFYEIVQRTTGKRVEVVYSKKGEAEHNSYKDEYQQAVSYFKYIAETLLKDHPDALKLVMNNINGVGIKVLGGSGKHPAADIQPQNLKLPLAKLENLANQNYAENIVMLYFLKGAAKYDDNVFKILSEASKEKNPNLAIYHVQQLEYIDKLLDEDNLYDALTIFKDSDFLERTVPKKLHEFQAKYEHFVNEFLENNHELTPNQIKTLKQLADYIHIDPNYLAQIDQLDSKQQQEEKDRKTKEQEAREKRKFILNKGDWKYVVLKKGVLVWENVPDKYISYRGDDIDDRGEFMLDKIVDREDVFYAAHEKASEDAYSNAEARPSENYGQDKDEVMDDIEYDADDFAEDKDIEPDVDLIKTKYYNDFIKWKIKKLKEKEEEESWRYEPEADEQDVHKYEEELAEEVAFDEYGLVIMQVDNGIEIEMNSKFYDEFKPILRKTIEISMREKNEFDEPMIRYSTKIVLNFRDKGSDRIMAKDVL